MKKYLVVFMTLISILNFSFVGSVNAASPEDEFGWNYADGWFDKNPGKFVAPPAVYDNNLNTSVTTETNGSINLNFLEPIEGVLGFYTNCIGGTAGRIYMYNGSKIVFSGSASNSNDTTCNKYMAYRLNQPITRVVFKAENYGRIEIKEIEFFTEIDYSKVRNLTVTGKTFESIDIGWKKPNESVGTRIYLDGALVVTLEQEENYRFVNLQANTNYKISVSAVYKDGESGALEINELTKDVPKLNSEFAKVSDIGATSVVFDMAVAKLPSIPKFIRIYKTKESKDPIYMQVYTNSPIAKRIDGLKAETEYTYYVSVDFGNGNVTEMFPLSFKTLEPGKEVIDLSATATAKEVSLTWKMPVYQSLDVARIYRQKKDPGITGMFARMFMSASTYEPIFETNGTSFKDLTVKADTEYKYKVTTADKSGNETEGKFVTVKTQKMSASGGGVELDPDGNYVITWTSPTTGKMKVLVGGVEYAVVPASDKKIIIPKDKMKFDIIGNPDVLLIPIDDDGNEGIPSKPGAGEGTGNGGGIGDIVGGGDLAETLSPGNILKGGMGLVLLVASILLLRMAFILVPKLIQLIRNALSRNNENTYERRRV